LQGDWRLSIPLLAFKSIFYAKSFARRLSLTSSTSDQALLTGR
jgi:hypothetical protein